MQSDQPSWDEARIDETLADSFPASDPPSWTLGSAHAPDERAVEGWLPARSRPVESLEVGRVLPARTRRMVGPFAFFDHLGPARFAPGQGIDVRPHPHIGLATVTYLFSGELRHRDSLGSEQAIRPAAVNWMTAGRGIVHSERTPQRTRERESTVHGLQLWVALPRAREDGEPQFSHYPAEMLPEHEDRGTQVRVLAGEAYGLTAPVPVASPLFYVDVRLAAGSRLEVPGEYAERAAYVIEGEVSCGQATIAPRVMALFRARAPVALIARSPARLVILGGEPLDGPRFIWWNFVSSSKERIVEAARAWRDREFPPVPGDEIEFVPMSEDPRFPAER
ncbi:MAG TPA: pirin family protein [Planctomycetota bacterium]|nr:pirin family protein [Planctomycetota bacterium]